MTAIPAMAQPCATMKARGAFFTPPDIADFLASWAIRTAADAVLEPSCGEAAFLVSAISRLREFGANGLAAGQLRGLDIHPGSVGFARNQVASLAASADLTVGDFFDLEPRGEFDAVLGNPPYVRYQQFAGLAREKAARAALSQGVTLTGLASSWAAFVVHAAAFLRPEGRLALVLPAELLSVNYASSVRRFLMRRFAEVRLVVFEERGFPGVLEEVVLLLAEGAGPTNRCFFHQARSFSDLSDLRWQEWIPGDKDKWISGLLPKDAFDAYEELVCSRAFSTLLDWGETNLGMVSGNNGFFALTSSKAKDLGLTRQDLLPISPPGSRHLRGLSFTESAWREMLRLESRVYLFDPNEKNPSEASLRYIKQGEGSGVHKAYKCKVRSPWWRVPRVAVPDLFVTYMNHDTPRLVANRARMHYLNSIHGVTLREGFKEIGTDLLPLAALNSVTILGAELVGRSYGGGMLKLEPKEADRLPLPSLETLKCASKALRALRPQLSRHLREGDLERVVALVDRALLVGHLKVTKSPIDALRSARKMLFSRRITRARKGQ